MRTVVDTAPRTFRVTLANVAFWQELMVCAMTEEDARAIAVTEANRREFLEEEGANAAAIGEDSPGPYSVHHVVPDQGGRGGTHGLCVGEVDLLASGGNG